MVYKKITSSGPVVTYLTSVIGRLLDEGKRVVWLVTGGSGIAIDVEVSKRLAGRDLHNLMVTLTDERFGPVGHADSNWQQLLEAGFSLPGARLMAVLNGSSHAETAVAFEATLKQFFEAADYTLGFFGMGADGHVAGILPGSPAAEAKSLACSYDAGAFLRTTITFPAFAHLDEAVLCAMGDEKRPALESLQVFLPLSEQPAQILKTVPKLTIYNNQIGDAS